MGASFLFFVQVPTLPCSSAHWYETMPIHESGFRGPPSSVLQSSSLMDVSKVFLAFETVARIFFLTKFSTSPHRLVVFIR